MHLLHDENGNPVPHGSHDAQHHDHSHGHDCESGCHEHCESGCKNEHVALLTYMLQHNEHHAAELDEMADKLEQAGLTDAAKQIRKAYPIFRKEICV